MSRRPGWRFDEELKAQAVRLVLDEDASVSAAARMRGKIGRRLQPLLDDSLRVRLLHERLLGSHRPSIPQRDGRLSRLHSLGAPVTTDRTIYRSPIWSNRPDISTRRILLMSVSALRSPEGRGGSRAGPSRGPSGMRARTSLRILRN